MFRLVTHGEGFSLPCNNQNNQVVNNCLDRRNTLIKEGDKISITRMGYRQRQHNIKKDPPDSGAWITEKTGMKTVEGRIGSLAKLYLPVTLPDKSVRHCLYDSLKFGKGNNVTFGSKLADRHMSVKQPDGTYKEINAIGKAIVVKAKVVLRGVSIPVVLGDTLTSIPYEEINTIKRRIK